MKHTASNMYTRLCAYRVWANVKIAIAAHSRNESLKYLLQASTTFIDVRVENYEHENSPSNIEQGHTQHLVWLTSAQRVR